MAQTKGRPMPSSGQSQAVHDDILPYLMFQETKHLRQYDSDDGEIRKQPGGSRRRADRPTTGREEKDWYVTSIEYRKIHRDELLWLFAQLYGNVGILMLC